MSGGSKVERKAGEGATSHVERVYGRLKDLAISFELLPGDRVNEVALARRLEVSRTPLREALNRLTSEGFLSFVPGKGFFRRRLDVKEIFDLYEMRQKLEIGLAELAVLRATEPQLEAIRAFLEESARQDLEREVSDLVALDERFHEQIAALSGNQEMLHALRTTNARIRFVRWIDMEKGRRAHTQSEHLELLEALSSRDAAKAREILQGHIDARLEQITAAIREGYARIYMDRASS